MSVLKRSRSVVFVSGACIRYAENTRISPAWKSDEALCVWYTVVVLCSSSNSSGSKEKRAPCLDVIFNVVYTALAVLSQPVWVRPSRFKCFMIFNEKQIQSKKQFPSRHRHDNVQIYILNLTKTNHAQPRKSAADRPDRKSGLSLRYV